VTNLDESAGQSCARPTPSAFETAIACYGVLGEQVVDFPHDSFTYVRVEGWETPSFSPLLLRPNQPLRPADLRIIEAFFEQHPITNPAIEHSPYINVIQASGVRIDSVRSACAEMGWIVDPDPLLLNLLHELKVVTAPNGFAIEVHPLDAGQLPPAYRALIRAGFAATDEQLDYITRALSRRPSWAVLLRESSGAIAAGGTVSVRGATGFLTWGTVDPACRQRGLHQVLLDACWSVAGKQGAARCAYATRNRLIRDKCDDRVDLLICRKRAP